MMKPKYLAAALALLLALVVLFSVLYLAWEADHDCCGEDCTICAQLQFCRDLLRSLLQTNALVTAACSFCALIRVFVYARRFSAYPRTLIALKVKLSN